MLYNLLSNRRSIRKYTDELVPQDTVDQLIKAILRSPSGKNACPWEIIYLDDESLIRDLAQSKKHGAKFLEHTKQCLVILADPEKTDVWIEDAAIAMTIGHLAASDLSLGSCWIQIRNRKTADGNCSEEYIRDQLKVPETLHVEALLPFGYPAEDKKGLAEDKLQMEKVKYNGYEKPLYK